MKIVVLLKMVPDVVEELEIAEDGKALDPMSLRMILSETSDHAVEQALLLKEKHGGQVTVVSLEAPEVDDALFTALAKGADRAVKISIDQTGLGTVSTARILAAFLTQTSGLIGADTLVLTGSQAIDDLEGELPPCLAELLALPAVGVVTGVSLSADGKSSVVVKEFSGGLRGEFAIPLPAVLGIQAAEKPPRYVPVAKVRAAMKSGKIERADAAAPGAAAGVCVEKMYKPEAAGRAEMVEGSPEEIAARLVSIMAERGLV